MKKILLISLFIFSTFLFFGCTENNTETQNITENNPILYIFYDPTWNLSIYEELSVNLKEKLPGLQIEKKCIDIKKYTENISSNSEQICVEGIGYLKYNENMQLLNKAKITSSPFVLSINNRTQELVFTPVTSAFANSICLINNSISGCDNLEQIKETPTIIVANNSQEINYEETVSFFKIMGLPLQTDNILNYNTEEAKQIYELNEITEAPFLLIKQADTANLDEEQKFLLEQFILMGYFEKTKNNDLVLYLPGEKIYVGSKYTDLNLELFIMSYCPYGLQAQKAVLPVKELFGDELNLSIKFVDYIMHGTKEIDENNLQYCLQEEHPLVFWDYLDCFTVSGESESCLNEINLTLYDLEKCINNLNTEYETYILYEDKSTWLNGYYPLYLINKEENDLYDVKGSPTFVFNGKQFSWPRSPEGIKQGICNLLENPPEVCNQSLSTSPSSTGFGGGTTSTSSGSCG
ncbi:MAG: hypothetical protein WC356_00810 [Candidatus Micrarchaeia archaeon]|jgi:hypothetical protein